MKLSVDRIPDVSLKFVAFIVKAIFFLPDLQEANTDIVWFIIYAGVAELADALDLGSSVPDVQVQVLSPAVFENSRKTKIL